MVRIHLRHNWPTNLLTREKHLYRLHTLPQPNASEVGHVCQWEVATIYRVDIEVHHNAINFPLELAQSLLGSTLRTLRDSRGREDRVYFIQKIPRLVATITLQLQIQPKTASNPPYPPPLHCRSAEILHALQTARSLREVRQRRTRDLAQCIARGYGVSIPFCGVQVDVQLLPLQCRGHPACDHCIEYGDVTAASIYDYSVFAESNGSAVESRNFCSVSIDHHHANRSDDVSAVLSQPCHAG